MGTFLWNHAPALLVAFPLFFAFSLPLVGKAPVLRRLWVLLGMALTTALGLALAYRVFTTGAVVYTFGALDPSLSVPGDTGGFPIRILFAVDAMSALMTVIISVVAFAITIYSLAAESKHSGLEGFYSLLFLLVVGVLGMVNTGDLFNFFVFLEVSSLAGAALAAFRVDKGVAVEAGFKYALVSTLGALSVLVAVGILYSQYNALNIAELARRIQYTNLDKIALVLLAVPLAMKCGSVPMHFWTPDAYSAAPSSVTAFLVATSQASLYALFRVCFTLFGDPQAMDYSSFGWFIITLGLLSMFVGVTMAIPQKDVKRLMAYHAVSQTGYMLLGVGVGLAVLGQASALEQFGTGAMQGGIFHIINHAMYKGLLFLTAGAVFFQLGTKNLNRMGGLGHTMPVTMVCFMIGALAIAGIPPFNGFASKLLIYETVFRFNPFVAVVAMLVSILTLASFVKVFHSVFMGPRLPEHGEVREVPAAMRGGMIVLALVVVAFGFVPTAVIDTMVGPAADALLDRSGYITTVLGGN
ncbi:NADH:ubiquinone oxidoreductase [candidate division GN15 bacterium]|nr:NADH:ubiquinone oxidoreductase [candidate division GN15 bacterium]